jgi:hypothetical protein
MDLEHGYFATANSRLTLLGDKRHWAIVFEKSGYANRASEIQLELNYFGSCLRNLEPGGAYHQFNYNSKYIPLVDVDSLNAIEAEFETVDISAETVLLRDQEVALPRSLEKYEKWVPGIRHRETDEKPDFADLGRYLAFEYESLCRATYSEISQCLPDGLAVILQLDEWHHKSYSFYTNGPDHGVMGSPPSSYETFPMLAEVLVTKDVEKYRPTLKPNSHWRNWPGAGKL